MLFLQPGELTTVCPPPQAWTIGRAMVQGALHEVACHGKPGLVCPDTRGAHDDMDIHTFLMAIPVLAKPFVLSAQTGLRHRSDMRELFVKLRSMGPQWEAELMLATAGVNTHRGLLFVGSLACAAAGAASRSNRPLTVGGICDAVARMCRGLCHDELECMSEAKLRSRWLTAGERLFIAHGLTGIRGEVETGLPSVRLHGLPALRQALERNATLEHALLHALVAIMTSMEDTTVIHRAGLDGLEWLQETADNIWRVGGALSPQGLQKLAACREDCLQRNISPGGAADILAVTVALYLLERNVLPEHVRPVSERGDSDENIENSACGLAGVQRLLGDIISGGD